MRVYLIMIPGAAFSAMLVFPFIMVSQMVRERCSCNFISNETPHPYHTHTTPNFSLVEILTIFVTIHMRYWSHVHPSTALYSKLT